METAFESREVNVMLVSDVVSPAYRLAEEACTIRLSVGRAALPLHAEFVIGLRPASGDTRAIMEDCWTSSSDCGAGVCHQDSCKEPYAKAWVALSQVLAEAGRQVIGAAKAGQSKG